MKLLSFCQQTRYTYISLKLYLSMFSNTVIMAFTCQKTKETSNSLLSHLDSEQSNKKIAGAVNVKMGKVAKRKLHLSVKSTLVILYIFFSGLYVTRMIANPWENNTCFSSYSTQPTFPTYFVFPVNKTDKVVLINTWPYRLKTVFKKDPLFRVFFYLSYLNSLPFS